MTIENAITPNAQKAIDLLAAFDKGDREEIGKLLHPEARWWVIGRGYISVEGLIDTVVGFAGVMDSKPPTILGITSEGDRVAIEAIGNITLPDGTPYRNEYHFLFKFRDGLIVEGKEYLDNDVVRKVFGDQF